MSSRAEHALGIVVWTVVVWAGASAEALGPLAFVALLSDALAGGPLLFVAEPRARFAAVASLAAVRGVARVGVKGWQTYRARGAALSETRARTLGA
jgi:hypothetical protein